MRQRPFFRNFDLRVEAVPGGYAISVTASPAGETLRPVVRPCPLDDTVISALMATEARCEEAFLRDVGQKLAAFLLPPGDVRDLYQRSLGMAQSEGFLLRLRLNVIPPELAVLPWELAYDDGAHEFFALNPRFSLVRYHSLMLPADSVTRLTPVPVLMVVASPSDEIPIAAADEVASLVDALAGLCAQGSVTLDILFSGPVSERDAIVAKVAQHPGVRLLPGAASLPTLRETLPRGYRVLHVVAHGHFDPHSGGLLVLTEESGRAASCDATTFARELRERMVAAVVLNVCRSATDGTARAFMGLAPSLIQAGIPAVIAMQHVISDSGALHFSRQLYRSLADGEPLDAAVMDGRKAVSATSGQGNWEWAVPVLFMRAQHGLLWEVDAQRQAVIERMDALAQRAQAAADGAARDRSPEDALLARGVRRYVERLRQLAGEGGDYGPGQPYKGLLEYRLGDAHLFFGRERAIGELLDRMRRGPLTILHAESGAGKSSLLQAGIMPRLIAEGHLPIHVRPYNLNPTLALKRTLLPELREAPRLSAMSLREFLLSVAELLGSKVHLYVMLDQFEEFFAELPGAERAAFVGELAACMADPLLNVHWLLALRSEAFSNLASFEPGIRQPFENTYRLARFTRTEAEAVIAQPAARFGVTYEPTLMTALLDDLDAEGVAPPQAQLVCQALYAEKPADETVITRALYDRLGGARGILQGHLERVLRRDLPPEQRVAAHLLLEALVSSDVRRIVRTRDELAVELAARQITPEAVDAVLERLLESRLLRMQESGVAGEKIAYELAHDYLATQIQISPEVRGRKAAQELLARELLSFQLYGTRLHPRALEVIGAHIEGLLIDHPAAELLVRSAFETGVGLLQWLARVPADLARTTLLEGLQERNPQLRARAAQHLDAYCDDEVATALADRFANDEAPAVRAAAFTTLAACAAERARQVALAALAHQAGERRAEAAACLLPFLDPGVAWALFEVVLRDDDEQAWTAALRVLSTAAARPFRADWRLLQRAAAARQAAAYGLLAAWRAPRPLAYHLRTLPALVQQYLKSKWRENWPSFIGAGLALAVMAYFALALWQGWPPFPAKWARVLDTPAVAFSALEVVGDRVYAGTFDYGVARRDPDGRWVFGLREGLPTGDPATGSDPASNVHAIYDLAVAAGAPDRVFAVVAESGVYLSQDAAASWSPVGAGVVPTNTTMTAAIAAYGETVLLADEQAGLYGSGDLGRSWRRLSGQGGLPDSPFRSVRFAPEGDAYIGGQDGVYRGSGAFPFAWEKLPGVPSAFYLDTGSEGRLFLGLGVDRPYVAACYAPGRGLVAVRTFVGENITAVHGDPLTADLFWVATTGGVYTLSCAAEGGGMPYLPQGLYDLTPIPDGRGGFIWLQARDKGLYQPLR